MTALATGLIRSLALAQATPSYLQSDVYGLVPAAVALAKPNDSSALYTSLPCLTESQFLRNAPALRSLRGRKAYCAAYGDMDGRDENFLSVLNRLRVRFLRSGKACKDMPVGINDPSPSDKDDADDKKDDEHNDDDEDTEKHAEQEEEEDAEKHLKGLKQDLVQALCGTNWGMTANRETHAVIADIITQLEAVNPNPAPTQSLELLDEKWIMVKVSQIIDSDSLTVENVVSFTGPYMTTSFTNCASFDVRSPKLVQLKFEETVIDTSQHVDSIDVPEQTAFMGHKIRLKSLQDILQPFQDMADQITKKAADHKPLRIPYPANRVQSWLLTTYVDKGLRIARAECGGVFALVKEGSPVLPVNLI